MVETNRVAIKKMHKIVWRREMRGCSTVSKYQISLVLLFVWPIHIDHRKPLFPLSVQKASNPQSHAPAHSVIKFL